MISIPALCEGATETRHFGGRKAVISFPAPCEGGDGPVSSGLGASRFQFSPSVRGDCRNIEVMGARLHISTRTPARGATCGSSQAAYPS